MTHRWTRQAVLTAAGGLVRHQRRTITSLLLWPTGGRHGVREGDRVFGYLRGEVPVMLAMLFVLVLEGAAMAFLIPWPVVHLAVLVLHVCLVAQVLGSVAAGVTRPHVVSTGELRVRYGAAFDLRIPLHLITGVRLDRRVHDGGTVRLGGDRLEVVVSARTSVTVELSEPVPVILPLGRTGTASLVRLHADGPGEFVRELSARLQAVRHDRATAGDAG
ncbi:hypothetical protein Ppa06_31170 [Planomonospora parontospora subsp. parontospora]|uniref:Uncharacterized protein n=2 Tax=Planomonospora parontospora TaxID=58119 RepID=A0AA37BHX6_9ACTN|nr:hypothetical protein [Planomonospora parontospora]GGK72811.1 hypothetical protein GCM10010126_35260 [Planomonospora parontospora]GII09319.1 hypothetical protein Ppa06_31170 [Planomonospora parontospora subsp. parontospora]